jgi:hypothetical protein
LFYTGNPLLNLTPKLKIFIITVAEKCSVALQFEQNLLSLSMTLALQGHLPEVDQHDLHFSSSKQLSQVKPDMAPAFVFFLLFCNL